MPIDNFGERTVEQESKKPLGVRLPDDLKQYLKHRAVDNRRSLNAELIVRLEASRRQDEAAEETGKKKNP